MLFVGFAAGLARGGGDDGLTRCVAFEFRFRAGPMENTWKNKLFAEYNAWGHHDIFERPWEETVYEESPYFPNGRLTVEMLLGGEEWWRMEMKEEGQP